MKRGIKVVRLRDAIALLDTGRGVYDVSDVGLRLERLIRSHDGRRLIAVGDQRVAVLEHAVSGKRLAQVDNARASWTGHGFEAPSGIIVVAGGLLGSPTARSGRWCWLSRQTASRQGAADRGTDVHGQRRCDAGLATPC